MTELVERDVEADLENRFVKLVEGKGWITRKLEYVGRRGAGDRICYGPAPRFALVELKNGTKGVLSRNQRSEIREMEKLGHPVWVIRDNNDLLRFAQEVLR